MAVLLQDNFDRANSTTVLGSPQVGPASSVVAGAMGISSNQAYAATAPGVAVYNLGTPDVELSCNCSVLTTANAAALVLGYVSVTDFWYVAFYSDRTDLWRSTVGGFATMASSYVKPTSGAGALVTAHHKDGIIRAYVDGVLVLRYALDAPLTSTSHGIRSNAATPRFDNLLGVDAPTISEPIKVGAAPLAANITTAAASVFSSSFAYLGRDTKLQDISEGA